jgi:hypothetical protein
MEGVEQKHIEEEEFQLWEREETSLLEIPLPRPLDEAKKSILLRQYGSNDNRFGIHSCVWDSGIAFIYFLAERYNKIRTKNSDTEDELVLMSTKNTLVIDVGSGTGVAGLGVAISLGYDAILTDLPDALDLLNENLVLNEGLIKKNSTVKVIELSWGGEYLPPCIVDMMHIAPHVIIIGADIVYQKPLFRPLLVTLRKMFDVRPDVECLLGSQSIRTHLAEFYEMGKDFGFQFLLQANVLVPEGLPTVEEVKPAILWTDSVTQRQCPTIVHAKDKLNLVEIVKVSL